MRQKDLKLVQMVERCELKKSMVADFAKPAARQFQCPACKKDGKGVVILVDNNCPVCGYQRS